MFNLDQIIEKVSGLFGEGGGVQELLGGNLAETLGNAGIDPSMIENLPLDQVREQLASAGIDVSSLTDGQVSEMVGKFTGGGQG